MLSDQQKIGLKLRKARIEKGLNQAELGALVGKSSTLVSSLETGRSGFAVETLKRFAIVLEKPLSYFYIWDDIDLGETILETEEKTKKAEEKAKTLETENILQLLIEKMLKILEDRNVVLPSKVSDKTDEEYFLELVELLPPDL